MLYRTMSAATTGSPPPEGVDPVVPCNYSPPGSPPRDTGKRSASPSPDEKPKRTCVLPTQLNHIERKVKILSDTECSLLDTKTRKQERVAIVISADDTDPDGLLGIPLYTQLGADLVFLVPLPAYTEQHAHDPSYAMENPYKGFRYTAAELDPELTNKEARQRIVDIVYAQVTSIYKEVVMPEGVEKGRLFICTGTTNVVTPFKETHQFKSWSVYGVHPRCPMDPDANTTFYNLDGPCSPPDFATYDKVIVDFSGSAAPFTRQILDSISACQNRYMVAMGGVMGTQKFTTLSAPFLNRHPSVTMNQGYHPARTMSLLESMHDMPTYFIPNNTVQNYSGITGVADLDEAFDKFLEVNGIKNNSLRKYLNQYWGHGPKAIKKPFDFYSSLVVAEIAKNRPPEGDNYTLSLESDLGRSILLPEKDGDVVVEDKLVGKDGKVLPDDVTTDWKYFRVLVPKFNVDDGAILVANLKAERV